MSLSVLNEVSLIVSRVKYDVQMKNIFHDVCPLPINNAKRVRSE